MSEPIRVGPRYANEQNQRAFERLCELETALRRAVVAFDRAPGVRAEDREALSAMRTIVRNMDVYGQ